MPGFIVPVVADPTGVGMRFFRRWLTFVCCSLWLSLSLTLGVRSPDCFGAELQQLEYDEFSSENESGGEALWQHVSLRRQADRVYTGSQVDRLVPIRLSDEEPAQPQSQGVWPYSKMILGYRWAWESGWIISFGAGLEVSRQLWIDWWTDYQTGASTPMRQRMEAYVFPVSELALVYEF